MADLFHFSQIKGISFLKWTRNQGQAECRGHPEVDLEPMMMNNIVLRGEKIPKVPKLVLEQEEDRTVLVEIQGSLLLYTYCMVNRCGLDQPSHCMKSPSISYFHTTVMFHDSVSDVI